MERNKKFFNKDIILLWQGQWVSLLGSQITGIALLLWMKHVTGIATLMGFTTIAFSVGKLLLAPLGGAVADIYSRKKIIIFSNQAAGVLTIVLGLLMFFNVKEGMLPGIVLIMRFIIGTLMGFFSPALAAAMFDMVPKDRFQTLNSLKNMTQYATKIVGKALGGVLVVIFGVPYLLIFDGITYLISSVFQSFMHIPQPELPEDTPTSKKVNTEEINDDQKSEPVEDVKKSEKVHKKKKKSFIYILKTMKVGLGFIKTEKGVFDMMVLWAAIDFFNAAFTLFIPFLVEDFLKLGPEWFGFMLAASGVGSFVGLAIVGWVKIKQKNRPVIVMLILIISSILFGCVGLVNSVYMGMSCAFLLAMLSAFTKVFIQTAIQHKVPSDKRGRILGTVRTITSTSGQLGMGLGGIILDLSHGNLPLVFLSIGAFRLLFVIIVFLKKNNYHILAYKHE